MKNFWLLLSLLLPAVSHGQLKLSPEASIHIVTCGPYQGELYSAFGHSAIRVVDPARGYDILYNYGVFDFDQPNFYLNFARGYLNYKLGVTDYQSFRDYYIYYNRFIHEQVLNLTPAQEQKLFDFLQWNALPENQYYRYDYFYDNCATRVRDAVKKSFGDDVKFDGSYIDTQYTIRDLTDIYLEQQPWGDLGIDICLGLPMDKVATPYMYMFLPDYIEQGFNHATIRRNGVSVPLVKETIITYESKPQEDQASGFTPLILFIILLIAGGILTWIGIKKNKSYFWFDSFIFAVLGLVGWLLFLLWTATDHSAAAQNFNLLWAIPFHFPVALLLIKPAFPTFLKIYFRTVGILTLLLIISWSILPQEMNNDLLPLALLIVLRAFFIQHHLSKYERNQNIY